MAKDPAFPFYASDWLGSNRRVQMTLEQQGAYINLLARQWSDPTCSLPDDDDALSKLSEMGQGWFKGGCQMVRVCFEAHPTIVGRIANKRLLELRAERDEWIEKSRQGGLKSAASKKIRQSKGGSTTVPTKRQPNVKSPSSSPSPSIPPNGGIPPSPPFDSKEFADAWRDWVAYRVEQKYGVYKPIGLKHCWGRLAKWGEHRAIAAIELSIANGWRGIYEEKQGGQRGTLFPSKADRAAEVLASFNAKLRAAENDS